MKDELIGYGLLLRIQMKTYICMYLLVLLVPDELRSPANAMHSQLATASRTLLSRYKMVVNWSFRLESLRPSNDLLTEKEQREIHRKSIQSDIKRLSHYLFTA